MERETVLVLDFGSQYTHLIARRIRELHVYSEIVPFNVGLREIKAVEPKGVVFSGGPDSVYVENAPLPEQEVLEWLLENNVPILGICYGHQLLALLLGGVVKKGGKGEYGRTRLTVIKGNELFSETPREQVVWMSHRDYVETPPPGAEILASTENSPVAAFKLGDKPVYGVQFHPEVRHTKHGLTILKNFLYTVCKCKGEWVVENLAGQLIGEIRREAPEGNILMAVSGGVDSTTAAYLIKEAVGPDRIHLIIIDTGLLREREAEEALNLYKTLGFKYIHLIDAKKEFLEALKGVTDPEEKRMIISRIYFKILDETSSKLASIYGDFEYLGQGTIYPDRVESGATSTVTARIKSHHNVVLAHLSRLRKLEPLKDLYKDEVRRLATSLGLPKELTERHPFPGPGLAIRIIGEVTEDKLRIVRRAHKIVEEEVKRHGLYTDLWQAFPVLLPVKTVGVMGDERTYRYAIAVRMVVSDDAMTAEFAKPPWKLLEDISTRIVNEIPEVNRVLYDITNKPPSTIEYE